MVYVKGYMRGGRRVKSHTRKGGAGARKLRQVKPTNVVFVRPDGTVQVRTMVPKFKKTIVLKPYAGGKKMTRAQQLMAMR